MSEHPTHVGGSKKIADILREWPYNVLYTDEEYKRRWPRLWETLLTERDSEHSLEAKIERLIADPACTPGEREAARRALERIRA